MEVRALATSVSLNGYVPGVKLLTALRDHIAEHSPKSAQRIAGQILDSVDLLASHPHMGRPGRVIGTRELVVPDTPYIIPYRVKGERLDLVAVFHGRQKWPKTL